MSTLISVIIPTRSRADTLASALRSVVEQDFDNYEIIVSDNNSEDNTREVVECVGKGMVRYLNTEKRLSMCDNWEFALSRAKGEYVIYIGDDDAIMPGGLRLLAQHINNFNVDAYTWRTPIYQWPIDGKIAKSVYNPASIGRSVSCKNLKDAAKCVMRQGGWRYYYLPSVYHGAIAMRVLKSIKESSGKVFHSTQPDLFTALAIPAFVEQFICLSSPVTLHGRSAKSNGGAGVAKGGKDIIDQFIRECGDYKIHSTIPLLPEILVGNLIVDSFLLAKDLFPSLYKDVNFNYSACWAFLRRLHLINKDFVYEHFKEIKKYSKFNLMEFEYFCMVHNFAEFRRKLINSILKIEKPAFVSDNIYDFSMLLSNKS